MMIHTAIRNRLALHARAVEEKGVSPFFVHFHPVAG
jgi:hypothetical protein